jgi:hypothetical protein
MLPLPGYFLTLENQSAPFLIFSTVDKPSSGTNPLAGQFFSGGQNLLTNPDVASGAKPGKLSTSHIESNPHRNYVLQWNLNAQRQVTSDLTVTLGYVGSHGVHMLIRGDDTNMAFPVQTSAGLMLLPGTPKVNSSLGVIRYIHWNSDAFYHAMNLNVEKRMSHGLQFQFAYTWSKSIDDNSSTIAGDTFGTSLNSLYWFAPKSLRGRSDFDTTQSATLNVLWAAPTPKALPAVAQAVLGGWQIGGILKLNSGIPTTVIFNGDPMGLGNNGADQFGIPNLIPGCNPVNKNYIGGTNPVYINVNCYSLVTVPKTSAVAANCLNYAGVSPLAPTDPNTYCSNLMGNAGRNTLNGPKLFNLDFSAVKNIPIKHISETFNVQFRAEIFNILNHSNFAPPEPLNGAGIYNDNGTAAANGYLDNMATQPRDVQFALKVVW